MTESELACKTIDEAIDITRYEVKQMQAEDYSFDLRDQVIVLCRLVSRLQSEIAVLTETVKTNGQRLHAIELHPTMV